MVEHLTMSASERERLKLFERVKRDELSLTEASEIGGLSYRQTRRMYKRYREEGDRGLVHRARGRLSNRAQPAEFKATVLITRGWCPGRHLPCSSNNTLAHVLQTICDATHPVALTPQSALVALANCDGARVCVAAATAPL